MIVQCPGCLKRYRIADARSSLLRVRCKSCGKEFLVAPSQESTHELKGDKNGITVVIADIQRDFRNTLVEILSRQGFHLYVVEDGEEALALIQEQKPRLLLVNPYLPKLMGTELLDRLRAGGTKPLTSILLGAIHNHRRYRRRPESLYGADDYIDEGWNEGAILNKLTYHLDLPTEAEPDGTAEDDLGLRAARIIFTDLLVYEPERMATVKKVDDFFEIFAEESAEGKRYIEERAPGMGNLLRQVVADYLRRR